MYFVGGPRSGRGIAVKGTVSDGQDADHRQHLGLSLGRSSSNLLFAQQYPAEYLGDTVGSLMIAIRNDLVIRETSVTMYYRAIGRPSKNALWSALYLGRASLVLFVTLLQRRNPGKKEPDDSEHPCRDHRGNHRGFHY